MSVIYALYSNNFERFLFVEKDLWVMLHTARLLSSKLCLTLCAIDNKIKIDNDICITWSLEDPNIALSDRQIARYLDVKEAVIDTKQYPLDIDLETIKKYKEFIREIYKSVNAAWMTDACLNANNQFYFMNLLDINIGLRNSSDNTGLEISFSKQIDQILYMANTKEEIILSFEKIFNQDSSDPVMLNTYKKTFYNYIKQYETFL